MPGKQGEIPDQLPFETTGIDEVNEAPCQSKKEKSNQESKPAGR
jgi:hypothetical protein